MQSDDGRVNSLRAAHPTWSAPAAAFALNAALPRVARAENDVLYMDDRHRCIDLFCGHGSVWLGHGNQEIVARVSEQLKGAWNTGGLPTASAAEAAQLIERLFPSSHYAAALYSTGMEAAEFAIRVARVATGRLGVVGFEGSMHGKSMATAYLGWDNRDGLRLPELHRLPFVQTASENQILDQLRQVLSSGGISAVFVEPIQGSNGGRAASPAFYGHMVEMCREFGVVSIFDEILSGFYRTGVPFCFTEIGGVPDVVLIGKSMGNGFPVSGVVLNKRISIESRMLPGSTFAGNPLATAAVAATLNTMRSMPLARMVAAIEQVITAKLCPLREVGVAVRGRGAMWILELPIGQDVREIVARCYGRGVLVGATGRQIRVLPAATIDRANLELACSIIGEQILAVIHGRGTA